MVSDHDKQIGEQFDVPGAVQRQVGRKPFRRPAAKPVPAGDCFRRRRQQRVGLGHQIAEAGGGQAAHLVGGTLPVEVRGQFPAAVSAVSCRLAKLSISARKASSASTG